MLEDLTKSNSEFRPVQKMSLQMAEIVICRKLEYICRIYIYGDLNGTMLDQCLSRGTT